MKGLSKLRASDNLNISKVYSKIVHEFIFDEDG